MPTKESHLAAASHNQCAMKYLQAKRDQFPGWLVVVAFYRAVHLVEAVFDADGIGHMHDHQMRNRTLKTTTRYQKIWKNYSPLWQASLIARYMEDGKGKEYPSCFAEYMPPEVVEKSMIGHYLHQVEQSALALIGQR
jgi:hypothetical protein